MMYKNLIGGKKELGKFFMLLNNFAMLFVNQSANSTCTWIFHQLEFPAEAEKFKR